MFYYYGRKKQIAKYYPTPSYSTIIEPFAGAAAYSLYSDNWKNKVILIEKDNRVAEIWEWLINFATAEEILKLPELKVGEKSTEFLHIIHAATKMAFKYKTIKVTPVLERNWEVSKRVMAQNIYKVKHWKIICADYCEADNIQGTWFIDPPYKSAPGLGYAHSSKDIDYDHLASWALERKGEVIVCEGESGDYLPFKPLKDLKGVAGKVSTEKIFFKTDATPIQKDFFINHKNTEFFKKRSQEDADRHLYTPSLQEA